MSELLFYVKECKYNQIFHSNLFALVFHSGLGLLVHHNELPYDRLIGHLRCALVFHNVLGLVELLRKFDILIPSYHLQEILFDIFEPYLFGSG